MAKFTPSGIIQNISGTLGGLNFTQGRNGGIVRGIATRQSNNSVLQLQQRTLAEMAARWYEQQILTDPLFEPYFRSIAQQITAPDSIGRPTTPSARSFAIDWFIRWQRINVFIPPIPTPKMPRTDTPARANLSASLTTGLILDIGDYPAFSVPILAISGSRSYGIIPPATFKNYRYIGSPFYTPFNLNLTTNWEAAFGPLRLNQWVSIQTEASIGLIPGQRLWHFPVTAEAQVVA